MEVFVGAELKPEVSLPRNLIDCPRTNNDSAAQETDENLRGFLKNNELGFFKVMDRNLEFSHVDRSLIMLQSRDAAFIEKYVSLNDPNEDITRVKWYGPTEWMQL